MSKKMTKAERHALEARARELAAELARREAKKAKKKAGKKAAQDAIDAAAQPPANKRKKGMKHAAAEPTAIDFDARIAERKAKSPSQTVADAAEKAKATPSSKGARIAAETAAEAAAEASDDETDAQIKARIKVKREARAAETAPIGGVTSTVEALDAIAEPDEKAGPVAEVVETEHGREFVVQAIAASELYAPGGPLAAVERAVEEFAKPSEAPKGDFEVNGNNQYKVKRPTDGKTIGYTRTTTYIANLEDRSMLEKWKLRMLLEGVAVNDHPDENGRIDEPVVATVRDLIHRRDVAIAKARKSDRKGRLVTGQLATLVDAAWSEFKKALNALAEGLLDVGGANEKSQKGTDIHALTEIYDREGIDVVGDMLTEGKITPADFDDIVAYSDAMKRAGIKLDLIEQTVVNDELKVAGRLDRTGLVKFPGMARATRCVIDIKTGKIELGAGKLAQQLEMYAASQAYDLDTDERTDMKLSRTKGVVVHLPAGSGECFIYPVDLVLGRKGNALSGNVRAFRNEGKRAVDFKTDLARPETFSMIEEKA